MKRRRLVALFAGAAATLAASRSAWPQATGKIYHLGGLTPLSRREKHWVALFDELGRHGFVEGVNLTVSGFDVAADRLEAGAADLVKAGVDAILSGGAGPTQAARLTTVAVPILTVVDDFVAQGFVTSLARPEGNVTGVSILGSQLDSKRQEILVEFVPAARRLAVLADPGSTAEDELQTLARAAQARGIEISVQRAGKREEIGPAIEAARQAEAINVLASQMFNVNHQEILARIAEAKIPTIYQWPEWVGEGALIAYGPSFAAAYRQLAQQVVKVLRGAKPADIPVEQPTKIELAINLKTAASIGFPVPPALLLRADTVIE
jgi:putative tryptophan/tyrosine transport system substrate-binding protein